jgi:uncharacterized membrane protein
VKAVQLLLVVAYPFAVYVGVATNRVTLTALLLVAVLVIATLVRLLLARDGKGWGLPALAALLAGMAALSGKSELLMAAPVLTNLGLMVGFGVTLFTERSIVEHLARLTDPELSDAKARYCRSVTMMWTGFFLLNAALIAALAVWAPLAWWTAYSGVIAYLVAGLVGLSELAVRIHRFGRDSGGAFARLLLGRGRG